MITRIENTINSILEKLVEKPQNKEMSLWLKRCACLATLWAIVYSSKINSFRCVVLYTIVLAAWFIDAEVSARRTVLYMDIACIGVVTGGVLTAFLWGDLGQIGCFIALTIAILSVFMLGLLWGNVLAFFNCAFMAVVFVVNVNNKMVDMYSEEFCSRFIYIMLCFMATANFMVNGMTDYWIYKEKYREKLSQLIENGKADRTDVYLKILIAMYKTLETKSPAMAKHSERTAVWSRLIARELGVRKENELKEYYYAGLLHDIGKIGIPDIYMDRETLTDEEYEVYKRHVDIGYEILRKLQLEEISQAALYHHEKWKGNGYKGLRGDEIPQIARIVAIANYLTRLEQQQGMSLEQLKEELTAQGGKAYDIRLVRLACDAIDKLIKQQEEQSIFRQSVF